MDQIEEEKEQTAPIVRQAWFLPQSPSSSPPAAAAARPGVAARHRRTNSAPRDLLLTTNSSGDVCIFLDLNQLLHTCGHRGQASTAVCGNSSERLRPLFPNPQLLLLLPKIRTT